MKHYDYNKAKELIKEYKKNKGLIRACLGMAEDWYWTAEDIWLDGKYVTRLNDKTQIAGISKSYWATPVLQLETDDNLVIKIDCYYEQDSDN
jgi:hypothetical protein